MRKVTSGVMVAILLLLVLSVGVNAQAVATNFNWVVTKLLTVTDTATFTSGVNVAGAMGVSGATTLTTLNATSNATIAGTLAVADQVAFSDELYVIPQDAFTVTNGSTLTVTGAVMQLTAALQAAGEATRVNEGIAPAPRCLPALHLNPSALSRMGTGFPVHARCHSRWSPGGPWPAPLPR